MKELEIIFKTESIEEIKVINYLIDAIEAINTFESRRSTKNIPKGDFLINITESIRTDFNKALEL